jgi:hypothetical protein
MSIKIYSGYDEFKFEEPVLCECVEDEPSYEEEEEDDTETEDLFFYASKSSNGFVDSSIFYVVSDLEDEENAEDISSYLGKYKKIYLPDSHKILFCVS